MLPTISRIVDILITMYCELFIKIITLIGIHIMLVIKDGIYFFI